MSRISPEELLDLYRKEAMKQAAIAEGPVRNFNKSSKHLLEIQQELRSLGRENDLLGLLDNPNQWVQLCAASGILEFDETVAMKKLRDLSVAENTWVSFSAQIAIMAWESGLRSWNTQEWIDEYNSWQKDFHSPTSQMTQELELPEAMEKVKRLLAKVKKIPRTVRFTDIQQLKTMENRFFAVDRTIGGILGMNADSVDFCPDNKPPSRDEVLAWLWVIHPEYKAAILKLGSDRVREVVLESEPE